MSRLFAMLALRSGLGVLIFIFGPKHQRLILTRSESGNKSVSQMAQLLQAENYQIPNCGASNCRTSDLLKTPAPFPDAFAGHQANTTA